ncbi:MAG: hypothetical protein HRF43_08220 [Phycisphaerae bacterium]|jgi:hypothetical protein
MTPPEPTDPNPTTTNPPRAPAPPPAADVELTPRERGFVARIMAKYPGGTHQGKDLHRSVAIVSGLILVAHLIEQALAGLAWARWWLPLLIVYPPAVFMFTRYRKFSIFRSCVLSKVAARLSKYETIASAGHAGPRPH